MADARPDPVRAPFVTTILLGSFLLFLVQPMIARVALPRLGGAPAVWNSAMLVYQALLLGGYAYAHALGRLAPRRQFHVHLGVLIVAALWLPIGLGDRVLPPGASPALWVPWLLAAAIGPLFFAVSAQAPLLQNWFAAARPGRDPYRLYAASNIGSFAGLIAYPLLVEPLLPVTAQRWLWSAGYAVLILAVAACGWRLPESTATVAEQAREPAPGARRVAHWIALAFVPSGLMLATSTYLTTDIVAMPLLWVLPLGLYLLSFSVAFAERRGVADQLTRVAPITLLLFGGLMIGGVSNRPWFGAILSLVVLFMVSVALHTALYRRRPEPARLTGFYLAMSAGGALGGVFAGLIAPVAFDWTWEYPLLILAAGALVPQVYLVERLRWVWTRWRLAALTGLVVVLAAMLLLRDAGGTIGGVDIAGPAFLLLAAAGIATLGTRLPYALVLATTLLLFGGLESLRLSLAGDVRSRSYFGVYSVLDLSTRRTLQHGTTLHGTQLTGSIAREVTPTTYYAYGSGVGRVLEAAPQIYGRGARIGVVGLGTGTLACYAAPGEAWRFYEIDPVIVRIARQRFSYLSRCKPDARVVLGDARLSIARDAPATLDVLALDAFSSDAIPLHLLTAEAFAGYARVLSRRGALVVHISNRFLDLEPVVAAAARAGGWRGMMLIHRPPTLDEGATTSQWIVLSRDPATLKALSRRDARWVPLASDPTTRPWTDDFASILPLVKF